MRLLNLIVFVGLFAQCADQKLSDDQAIEQMTEWIKSPMEFGGPPVQISIRDSRKINWPGGDKEDAWLIDFEMSDGKKYTGFTGPVTWTFFDTDYTKLSDKDLYELYAGWFLSFISYQEQDHSDPALVNGEEEIIRRLSEEGLDSITVTQKVMIAGDPVFEILANNNGTPTKIAGTNSDYTIYDNKEQLVLYKYVGAIWGPLE